MCSLPDDETLRDLGERDPAEVRRWLRDHQPDRRDGPGYWWENLTWLALLGVYRAQDDDERHRYACVVKAATDEAVDLSVLSEIDGAIRIANLALYLARHGSDLFDVNEVVARCLSLIGLSFEEAAKRAGNWRSLSHTEMLALRQAKMLVSISGSLIDGLTDTALLTELRRWAGIRDQLP